MARKIQFRRGPDADRDDTVLSNGEPGFSTDTKQLYIGDGETLGGIPISMARTHIITTDTTAIVGCKYAFKAPCKLHLPATANEGERIAFCVLSSSTVDDNNKAQIVAVNGLVKSGGSGTEYHTALFIERVAVFTNSKWEII